MDDSKNISSEVVQTVGRTNQYDNSHTECSESSTAQIHDNQNHKVQNIICFWTVGLCNGFGWTVMLSATYDILKGLDGISENQFTTSMYSNNSRECLQASPAILLLANTIPSLITKIAIPFLPFYVNANIVMSCVLASASFITVAVSQHEWQAIVGIVFMSICAALGDTTVVVYLTKFIDKKNMLLAFSSGIGASGVAASLSYAALIDVGFTPKITLYLMLIVPLVEFVAFMFIKESNAINLSTSDSLSTSSLLDDSTNDSGTISEPSSMTLSEKRQQLPKLMKYFVPMLINYICEYVINQMFDLLYVPGIWLNHADQYRWLQVLNQVGGFVGRSSMLFISMDDIWSMNLLIGAFTMYFAYEAVYLTVPIIWIIFIFVFSVGFVSGCTNLSIYYQLTNETPLQHQVFAICCVSTGVSFGVIAAALMAMPIHNIICNMASPF